MNTLFVVSGVSGSGKTTIMKQVMDNELISVTTREPRLNEVDGRDYYFISKERYKELYDNGELAEWSDYSGHGNMYGITYEELDSKLEQGNAFVISDYNGMKQFLNCSPDIVTIFIDVDMETAIKQMKFRGESEELIQKRISTYEEESKNKDYYHYVVKNEHGKIDKTIKIIKNIIERKRVYISGQMSGLPEFNFPEFNRVAKLLYKQGYIVLNPASHGVVPNWTWEDYMKKDITDLVTVDIVATLPSWQNSRGAKLEVYIAEQLGIKVVDYNELLVE